MRCEIFFIKISLCVIFIFVTFKTYIIGFCNAWTGRKPFIYFIDFGIHKNNISGKLFFKISSKDKAEKTLCLTLVFS